MENATKEEILKELFTHFNQDITDIYEKGENNKEIYNTFKYEEDTNIHKFEHNGLEYNIIESEDEAERIAIEQIKEDLEEDPGMFTQTWLQDFIYISDTDKRLLCNEEEDNLREMITEDTNIEDYENEEEYNNAIDEVVNKRLEEYRTSLENPIEYFVNEQGMFTIEDLMKQNWISINVNEAAEDAIRTDGWAHFLSRYDGEYETTQNGIVYFRDC